MRLELLQEPIVEDMVDVATEIRELKKFTARLAEGMALDRRRITAIELRLKELITETERMVTKGEFQNFRNEINEIIVLIRGDIADIRSLLSSYEEGLNDVSSDVEGMKKSISALWRQYYDISGSVAVLSDYIGEFRKELREFKETVMKRLSDLEAILKKG